MEPSPVPKRIRAALYKAIIFLFIKPNQLTIFCKFIHEQKI